MVLIAIKMAHKNGLEKLKLNHVDRVHLLLLNIYAAISAMLDSKDREFALIQVLF